MSRSPAPTRLLCLDIETVPDRERLPSDWGDRFPKPIHHKIAAISFVEATILVEPGGTERYEVSDCRSGGLPGWDEARLLESFWTFFGSQPTRCSTWNGRAFDMPVLLQRSMVHGVTAGSWFQGTRYEGFTHRFSPEWHCDLMDVVADYGASAKLSLDETAGAVGMPGKVGGHGSQVESMVNAGKLEQVRRYCETDCMNLFGLYVRHGLLTGRLDHAGHDASLRSLELFLRQSRATNPHFAEFLELWRPEAAAHPVSNITSEAPSCEQIERDRAPKA